jgi:hypothetical protein
LSDEESVFWDELTHLGETEVRKRVAANHYAMSNPAYNQMALAFLGQERLRIEREKQDAQTIEVRRATRVAWCAMAISAMGVAIALAALLKGFLDRVPTHL